MAEDDPSDAQLALGAFASLKLSGQVFVAKDGVEALDYLRRRGPFHTRQAGQPALVLLDLQMPRADGFQVLLEMRNDPELKAIPVVMFTSSPADQDVQRSYQLGANAYVVKPLGFDSLVETLGRILGFWLDLNHAAPLPRTPPPHV